MILFGTRADKDDFVLILRNEIFHCCNKLWNNYVHSKLASQLTFLEMSKKQIKFNKFQLQVPVPVHGG